MDDVDIGLFDYDRNNTLYFFALNADEQIYFRYGGRDSQSPAMAPKPARSPRRSSSGSACVKMLYTRSAQTSSWMML